jgi:acetyltransferase-like isoleucine patch superfamily enzyme
MISTHCKNAEIIIGDNCSFSAVVIGARESIQIGNNVMVGANVLITDTDWHSMKSGEREHGIVGSKPVFISDNVFIGYSSSILKGVSIGKNSVIGANSVVTKDIPANVIAAGNPCKIIKTI